MLLLENKRLFGYHEDNETEEGNDAQTRRQAGELKTLLVIHGKIESNTMNNSLTETRKLTLLLMATNSLFVAYISLRLISIQPEIQPTTDSSIRRPDKISDSNIVMCGPAALAVVLKDLGINTSIETIARLAGMDENGTTMYGLADAARKTGCEAVGMRLSFADLQNRKKPLIAHLRANHFIAIQSIGNDRIVFTDQTGVNLEMPQKEFLAKWDGYVLIVTRH